MVVSRSLFLYAGRAKLTNWQTGNHMVESIHLKIAYFCCLLLLIRSDWHLLFSLANYWQKKAGHVLRYKLHEDWYGKNMMHHPFLSRKSFAMMPTVQHGETSLFSPWKEAVWPVEAKAFGNAGFAVRHLFTWRPRATNELLVIRWWEKTHIHCCVASTSFSFYTPIFFVASIVWAIYYKSLTWMFWPFWVRFPLFIHPRRPKSVVKVKDPCVPHPRRVTGPACGPCFKWLWGFQTFEDLHGYTWKCQLRHDWTCENYWDAKVLWKKNSSIGPLLDHYLRLPRRAGRCNLPRILQ